MTSYRRNTLGDRSLRAVRACQASASCFPPFFVRGTCSGVGMEQPDFSHSLSIFSQRFEEANAYTHARARTHTRHHGHANRLPCMNTSIARDSRALKSGKPVG